MIRHQRLRGLIRSGVFVVLTAATLASCTILAAAAAEQPVVANQVVQCMYTDKPINITGRIDDPAWQKAKSLPFYSAADGKDPISKTEARVLWDDKYLYICYKAYDKDIWGYFKNHDDWTYQEDACEVFFKTDPAKEPYYNIEVNVLGTVMDMFTLKVGAGGEDSHRWRHWNCEGIKTKTFIKGTLNNPYDVDEYWQLEVAIPFASLPTMNGKSPKPGDTWRLLLSRYDYSVYLPKGEELSTIVPVAIDNFHDPTPWVTFQFVK